MLGGSPGEAIMARDGGKTLAHRENRGVWAHFAKLAATGVMVAAEMPIKEGIGKFSPSV
jgi:hypothetical protein